MRINDRYTEETKRIRKEYLKNLKEIIDREKVIIKIKNDIEVLTTDIENTGNEIDEELTQNRIYTLEKDINNIQKELDPYIKNINTLKKDADNLFESIKEDYPDMTKEELKNQLKPFINDVDNMFNF